MTTVTIDIKRQSWDNNRGERVFYIKADGTRFINWDTLAGFTYKRAEPGYFEQIDQTVTLAYNRHEHKGSELYTSGMMGGWDDTTTGVVNFGDAPVKGWEGYIFPLSVGITNGYDPLVTSFFVEPGDTIRFGKKDWIVKPGGNAEHLKLELAQ